MSGADCCFRSFPNGIKSGQRTFINALEMNVCKITKIASNFIGQDILAKLVHIPNSLMFFGSSRPLALRQVLWWSLIRAICLPQ